MSLADEEPYLLPFELVFFISCFPDNATLPIKFFYSMKLLTTNVNFT